MYYQNTCIACLPTLMLMLTTFAVWIVLGSLDAAWASPQFARQYRVDCSFCHVAPPRLNQQGENFLARGYQLDPAARIAAQRTLPLAAWNTVDIEHRDAADLTKGFPSGVEIISGGRVGRTPASYFIELRALSQQIGSGHRLLNRVASRTPSWPFLSTRGTTFCSPLGSFEPSTRWTCRGACRCRSHWLSVQACPTASRLEPHD
jgi:hypothetical protein